MVVNSPKKFKVNEDVVGEKDSDCAELKSLEDVMEHQQVSITGKVTSLRS